jgi:hypothetical protein
MIEDVSANTSIDAHQPVPCAARPSTGFMHLDGPCRCFAGGPAPEFPPADGHPDLSDAA